MIRRHAAPGVAGLMLALLATSSARGPVGGEGDPPRLVVEQIAAPAGETDARFPRPSAGADGRLYLSWLEERSDEHALRFSVLADGGDAWEAARTITRGSGWFVNWADFPSVAVAADGTIAAHWLEKNGAGTYAYGVRVLLSTDAGASFVGPFVPHRDRTETEHGFVSIVPLLDARFGLVWLDGRATAEDEPMALRYAAMDRAGAIADEAVLDDRVCDCCPTAAVRTAGGELVVAFRDRSEDEVRDVSIVRRGDAGWSSPASLHADGWKIEGCPVNGPALATRGDRVAAAWFSAADVDAPMVRFAWSDASVEGGFGAPIRIDAGRPIGRVDVAFIRDGVAVVSWVEPTEDGRAAVLVRTVSPDGRLGPPATVATVPAERAAGMPRLAAHGDAVLVAWTVPGPTFRIGTARIRVGE